MTRGLTWGAFHFLSHGVTASGKTGGRVADVAANRELWTGICVVSFYPSGRNGFFKSNSLELAALSKALVA